MKLEYRLEQYRIDAEGNAPIFFWQQDGDYLRSHVELSYTIDTRDAQIFPAREANLKCWPVIPAWAAMCIHTISA